VGSATRGALARATTALDAASGVSLSTGEQLLSAGRAIEGSAQLRAVLSDPAVETSRKSALIAEIFGTLDPVAATLLGEIAESRWSNQDELLDGIEEVGIRAIASSAAAGAAGNDAGIEAELFAFSRAVSSDPELELAVGSKLSDPAGRVALVESLLAGKASAATVSIIKHLVQSPRGRRIGGLVAHAADIVADAAGSVVATVTAAQQPTDAQLERLVASLATQYGRAPRVNLIIDPDLVGGLRVQLGDEVIDGSLATRLAELRLRLAG
jgi:F-type H+-transporting ATPase subunit delta